MGRLVRLASINFLGTNTLAYSAALSLTKKKKFYNIASGVNDAKLFSFATNSEVGIS
jgi:hypothetical protein